MTLKIPGWIYRRLLSVSWWLECQVKPCISNLVVSGRWVIAENCSGDCRCEACGCRIWNGDKIFLQEVPPYNSRPYHERCTDGRKFGDAK